MNQFTSYRFATAAVIALVMAGCSGGSGAARSHADEEREHGGEHDRDGGEHSREGRSEVDRDGDDHHGAEGEESGTELGLDQTHDEIRNGARLILAYDAERKSFRGTVENSTDATLEQVRVEVHLSNGRELGPTTPADLEPGEKVEVELTATSEIFDGWTAHPEVGRGEHGHGQGESDHERDDRDEHQAEGDESSG